MMIVAPPVVVLVGLLIWAWSWHSRLYRVTVLPEFRRRVVTPCAINDHAQIVGVCRSRFYLWERGKDWQELGKASGGLYINNAGQIAGTIDDRNGGSQAFLWDPNEGLTMLGTLGTGMSDARALNNRGEIVGQCRNSSGVGRVFLWSKARGMRAVTDVDGLSVTMNDAGQVIGLHGSRIEGREVVQHFLWESATDGSMKETSLPASALDGLNNNGYIVGQAFNFDKQRQYAFIWRQDCGVEWLFSLESQNARVAALNDANQVAVCDEVHSGWLEKLTRRRFGLIGSPSCGPARGDEYSWMDTCWRKGASTSPLPV
jgi:probable HAF family extracellular repeat protein